MEIPQNCIEQLKNIWDDNPSEKDEFSSLDFGDIIYAKRYTNDEERKKIRKGHEVGPFLVIKNDGDTIEALLGTSSKSASFSYNLAHLLMYDTPRKDTFYRLNDKWTITRDMYISCQGKLSKRQLIKLRKILTKYQGVDNKVGDIILYYDEYYVISNISEELELYKLKEDAINYVIGIKNKNYAISKEKVVLSQAQKLVYTGYSLDSILFPKEIKDYRGYIIKYEDLSYYVYGVSSNELNCFRVNITNNCLEQFRIKTDSNIYEADWESKKDILIDSKYEMVDQVSHEELEKIKEKKKKALKFFKNCPNPNAGTNWFVRKNNTNKKYIIVRRNEDTLYLVDIRDLKNGIFDNIIIGDPANYEPLHKLDEIDGLLFFGNETNYSSAKEKCLALINKHNQIK